MPTPLRARSVGTIDRFFEVATPMLDFTQELVNRTIAAPPDSDLDNDDEPAERSEPTRIRPPQSRRRFIVSQCNGLLIALILCMSAFCYLLAKSDPLEEMLVQVVNMTLNQMNDPDHETMCINHPEATNQSAIDRLKHN